MPGEIDEQSATKMAFEHCHWIPIITGIWYTALFATTYAISAVRKDVYPVFPYISDTGNWQPESVLFTFGLNTGALLMISIVYIRYRHVNLLIDNNDKKFEKIRRWNKLSLYIGIVACIALMLTGDIQLLISVFAHATFAGISFDLAVIFLTIQTYISYKIYPGIGCKTMNAFRLFLNFIAVITLGGCSIFAIISYTLFYGDDITKWTPTSGGYELHIISVVAEWILAASVVYYLTSFAGDFKKIKFYTPNVEILQV